MTFYKREIIDNLLIAAPYETVLTHYGFTIKGTGKNRGSVCPKCNKDHGHFKINTHRNLANCFVCGFKGNAIQLVQYMENVTFIPAVQKLASIVDFELVSESKPETTVTDKIYNEAAVFYSKFENDYLEKRGITKKVQKDYEVGYAQGQQVLLEHLTKSGYTVEECLESGLIVERQGKMVDFFYNCVIFPIKMNGKIIDFYGRHIGKASIKHVYLKGDFMVYNIDNINAKKSVVYVESIINALTLISNDVTNVVAVGGSSKFNTRHVQALKNKGVKGLINGFDTGDSSGAGQKGAIASGELIEEFGLYHLIMMLPTDTDINELFLKQGYEEFKKIASKCVTTAEFELRFKLKDVPDEWIYNFIKERSI